MPKRCFDDHSFDQEVNKLQDLIKRLERMRGPYMGDGINPGFTTHEVLEFLNQLDKQEAVTHNSDIATKE